MSLHFAFLVRSAFWCTCSVYLAHSLLPSIDGRKMSKLDRFLRFAGVMITGWLGVVALGRGLGFLHYP
jgi:hypothetical protein